MITEERRAYNIRYYAKNADYQRASAKKRWAANRPRLIGLKRQREARNRDVIRSFKFGKACTDCGSMLPEYCMDFDHVHGTKASNVSGMLTSSVKRLVEEINKTVLVCANCHRIRTQKSKTTTGKSKFRGLFVEQINALKACPCVDCNKTFPTACMDFHHVVDGSKEFNIGEWSRRKVTPARQTQFDAEVAKCVILCAVCHRQRHYAVSNVLTQAA